MRTKDAPGPDDIYLTPLKALGPIAGQELQNIFNVSFSTEKSTQTWKVAIILQLKKVKKSPGCISCYGTNSLTPYVATTFMLILQNRLMTDYALIERLS